MIHDKLGDDGKTLRDFFSTTGLKTSYLVNVLLLLCLSFSMPLKAEIAPDFMVPMPEGEVALKDLRGKVVYVDFWASWCVPCRKSFPWMNRMQTKYRDEGLIIVAINVDEDPAAGEAFLKIVPAKFAVKYDPKGELAEAFKLIGMPSSFLIGREGKLRSSHMGFRNDLTEKYEQEIKELLAEPVLTH